MARRKKQDDSFADTITSPLRAFERANLMMKMLITGASAYLLWRKYERDQEEEQLRQFLLAQAQRQAGFSHEATPMTGPGVNILPTQGTPEVSRQGISYEHAEVATPVPGPMTQALSS